VKEVEMPKKELIRAWKNEYLEKDYRFAKARIASI
jgi:hypothetical protein